jgi:hypothetical protein
MSAQEYMSFRARRETEEEFWVVKDFCEQHRVTFSAFFNSILPSAAHCIRNYTKINEDGNPVVEMNLGEIEIK